MEATPVGNVASAAHKIASVSGRQGETRCESIER